MIPENLRRSPFEEGLLGATVLAVSNILGPAFYIVVAIWSATFARYRGLALTEQLLSARADVVMTIADEIAVAEHPKGRAQKLQRRLRLYIELSRKPFPIYGKVRKRITVDEQEITVLHGPSSPMILKLQEGHREGYLMVKFPVDIDAPKRKIWGFCGWG